MESQPNESPTILARIRYALPGAFDPGRLGVVTGRAGGGKSACLVQLALAHLVEGHGVLHIALDLPIARVRQAYEERLEPLRPSSAAGASERLRLETERRRLIYSYLDGSFTPQRLGNALTFVAEHMDFRPELVVIDGHALDEGRPGELAALRAAVADAHAALWLSVLTHRHEPFDPPTGLPQPVARVQSQIDTILHLEATPSRIEVRRLRTPEGGPEGDAAALWLHPATRQLNVGY